jgi:hypothetical protein
VKAPDLGLATGSPTSQTGAKNLTINHDGFGFHGPEISSRSRCCRPRLGHRDEKGRENKGQEDAIIFRAGAAVA